VLTAILGSMGHAQRPSRDACSRTRPGDPRSRILACHCPAPLGFRRFQRLGSCQVQREKGVRHVLITHGPEPPADGKGPDRRVTEIRGGGIGTSWTIASQTSTPVGNPLQSTRPALRSITGVSARAASELLRLRGSSYLVTDEAQRDISLKRILAGVAETFRHPMVLLRGSLIGAGIGAIPSVGSSVANLVSKARRGAPPQPRRPSARGRPRV
jgi:hypothetical protein